MDTTNAYLPTHPLDVETWLRKLAEGSRGYADGEYPFLFGMATVKLAEANAEIVRLRRAKHACAICDAAHDSREEAEQCERDHESAHDAWCQCEACLMQRAADAAEEADRG